MNELIWTAVGKPLAVLGGRSFAEVRGRSPAECDKSIAVGLLCVVSVAVIFAGHWLFWASLPHTADIALPVAAAVAAVFAVMYRVALRAMETMGRVAKTLTLSCLVSLMGVNAALAGHELALLAFRPQAEEQARLGAARSVSTYGSAVEASLGLPRLRSSSTELDKAVAAAKTERERTPDVVLQLQRQARGCDARAAQLHARIPADPDDPGHAAATSAWREQRARCRALVNQATQALAQHQAEADRELARLIPARDKAHRSLEEATTRSEETLERDTPTLTASATTGFARHAALWAAVAAGTVPLWAAAGLMFMVGLADAFSFVVKLLARDDIATIDRIQASDTALLHARLHAEMVREQRRLVSPVVRSMRSRLFEDVEHLAREAVAPSVVQAVAERSLGDAADDPRHDGDDDVANPSMLARVARLARRARQGAANPADTERKAA